MHEYFEQAATYSPGQVVEISVMASKHMLQDFFHGDMRMIALGLRQAVMQYDITGKVAGIGGVGIQVGCSLVGAH